jgi:outer membrane protein assembly factor BamB
VLALVLGALLATAGEARAGNAVSYLVDQAHDGFVTDPLTPPLSPAWSHDFGAGTAVSYPLIAQGKVYVTVADASGYGSTLYALDAATGDVAWSRSLQTPGSRSWSAAAYDNGRIFAVGHESPLKAFNAGTGALLWSVKPPAFPWHDTPPVATNGLVFESDPTNFGTLDALRESSGGLLWRRVLIGLGPNSTPALGGGKVYLSYMGPYVYALSQTTGALGWSSKGTSTGGYGWTPMLAGGKLWTTDPVQGHQIYDAATGAQLGTFDSWTPPAFAGDTALFMAGQPDAGGTLEARDPSTLALRWSFQGDGTLITPPIAVSNGDGTTAYVGGSDGSLYALDLADGHVVWSGQIPWSIRATDDGTMKPALAAGQGLLVVPAESHVYAFSGAPPPNLLPNPSFEGSLDGWTGTSAILSLADDAKLGSQSGKATRSGASTTFGMIAAPPPVGSSAAGTVYKAGGWVRSDTPGRKVCVGLRDWTPTGIVRTAPVCVTSTTSWQQLPSASYKAPRNGDKLDVYVVELNAAPGDSFQADALNLTAG